VTAVTTAGLLAGLFGSAFVPAAQGVRASATPPVAKYTVTKLDFGDGAGGAADADTADADEQWDSTFHYGTADKTFAFLSDDSDRTLAAADSRLRFWLYTDGTAGAGTDEMLTADLKAVSSNSNIQVAWAYETDGTAVDACTAVDGTGETSLFAATDIVTNVADEGAGGLAGLFELCVAAKTATTAATSTISVYAAEADTAAWVLVKTVTVIAVGPVASLTMSLADGYKYVSGDNDEIHDKLTVIGKDAAGTIINNADKYAANFTIATGLTEYAENPVNVDDLDISFFTAGTVADDALGAANLFSIDAATCALGNGDDVGSDAGRSYALKIENAAGTVVSNAISITCTMDETTSRVTKVTPEATQGGQDYTETDKGLDGVAGNEDDDDLLELYATVVDENGLPLGDGAAAPNFDWTIEFTSDDLDDTLGNDAAEGGRMSIGHLAPGTTAGEVVAFGKYSYVLTAADSDLAVTAADGDAVEKEFTLAYYAVSSTADTTITVTMNKAKTSARILADMGEEARGDSVYFQVELRNGDVKEYKRRANADGVAQLVLNKRRTTNYVWAALDGGADTDTLKIVFK